MLRKYEVPPSLLNIIRSLHDGMKAEITVDGAITPEIEVTNGLRQGCTIAPTLFNLYFNLVMGQWYTKRHSFGTEVHYKCGGKLVGERTRRPLKNTVTKLQFADDAALVCSSRKGVERSARVLDQVAPKRGLTLSLQKTKLMVAGTWSEEDLQPIVIRGDSIEVVSEFCYLGSIVEMHGEVPNDAEDKIARDSRPFGVLCRPVIQDKGLSMKTKKMVVLWSWECCSMGQRPG